MQNPGKTLLESRNETYFRWGRAETWPISVGESRNYGPAFMQLRSVLNSSPGCVGEDGNQERGERER